MLHEPVKLRAGVIGVDFRVIDFAPYRDIVAEYLYPSEIYVLYFDPSILEESICPNETG